MPFSGVNCPGLIEAGQDSIARARIGGGRSFPGLIAPASLKLSDEARPVLTSHGRRFPGLIAPASLKRRSACRRERLSQP